MISEGEPYILPFNYGYSDNTIYIHSSSAGRKIEILKRNNRVCFEIEYGTEIVKNEISCKWTTKYRCLIGYGSVEIITDNDLKRNYLDIIMKHNGKSSNNIYEEKHIINLIILKLNIEKVTGKQSGNWEDRGINI